MKKILGVIALMLILAYIIGGVWHPDFEFVCPYDDISAADRYIEEPINVVPQSQIDAHRTHGGRWAGYTAKTDNGWTIYISNELSTSKAYDAVEHEKCHVYELNVLRVSMDDAIAHKGWDRIRF